jgi:hypothetical protein
MNKAEVFLDCADKALYSSHHSHRRLIARSLHDANLMVRVDDVPLFALIRAPESDTSTAEVLDNCRLWIIYDTVRNPRVDGNRFQNSAKEFQKPANEKQLRFYWTQISRFPDL